MRSWGLLPDGSWGTWELSQEPNGLPRTPIKSWILVAFTMLLVQSVSQIIKYVATLRGIRTHDDLRSEVEETLAHAT